MLSPAQTTLLPPAPAVSRPAHGPAADLHAQIRVEKPGPWLQFSSAMGYEWTRVDLPIPRLPEEMHGLRLLHLSDFHARSWWDPAYDDLIARVAADPPDFILFTGDFVDHKNDHRPGLPVAKKLFSLLKSRLGTIAILGNHDKAVSHGHAHELNVNLIDHRRVVLPVGSANLELIGLGGVDRIDVNLAFLHTIGPKSPNSLRVILSHYPDNIRRSQFLSPDLYLCGHTHGGQMCFPNRKPILRHDSLPHRLCSGIHRAYGTWMIANRGFGYSSYFQFRVFCPAEVIEIRLIKA
ncbi:MAG: metallophosphoesterase [Tepidisphaeraceae bacterium]|jgi:predicted MPP superfamily phosphohydrolase